jgi:hypothetical protein
VFASGEGNRGIDLVLVAGGDVVEIPGSPKLESIDVGPFSDHDMEAINEFSCIDECRQPGSMATIVAATPSQILQSGNTRDLRRASVC